GIVQVAVPDLGVLGNISAAHVDGRAARPGVKPAADAAGQDVFDLKTIDGEPQQVPSARAAAKAEAEGAKQFLIKNRPAASPSRIGEMPADHADRIVLGNALIIIGREVNLD